MKKLFAIMAVVMLVVACGGEQKKPMTLEEQFLDYITKIEQAVEARDVEQVEALAESFEEWGASLSESDLVKIQKVVADNETRIMSVMMACEALEYAADGEYYEECLIEADEAIEIYKEIVDELDEASDLD